MTRFNISIDDGVKMIFFIKNAKGGEILFQNCHPLKLKI